MRDKSLCFYDATFHDLKIINFNWTLTIRAVSRRSIHRRDQTTGEKLMTELPGGGDAKGIRLTELSN